MSQGGPGLIGNLPSPKRRATLAQYVVRSQGNVQKLAFLLGYNRSHVYRLLYEYNMWPVVNAARRKRKDLARLERNPL